MVIGRTPPFRSAFAAALVLSTIQALAVPPLLNDLDRVTIPASVHPRVKTAVPKGPLEPATPLGDMVLVLKMSDDARSRAEQLLADQADPTSPRYHQWLTPEQFGEQFGPSEADLGVVKDWLGSHGLKVSSMAKNGLAITFNGGAAQVEHAFATRMSRFEDRGVAHVANSREISVPRALSGLVAGVLSLHDYRRQPTSHLIGPMVTGGDGSHYLSPADFARIYNLTPLYQRGLSGNLVNIGVVGRTDIEDGDFFNFQCDLGQAGFGYPDLDVIHNGPTPGLLSPNEEFEADLDTQWAWGLAPGASIKLVVSPSSLVTDGVDLSAQYLVDTNIAPIITMSFSEGEDYLAYSGGNTFYSQLWLQASSQGISVFVSAGDSGAAGDDNPSGFTGTMGQKVSGLASTPYNTCVGGTMFLDSGGTYWGTTGAGGALPPTALGYIPEAAWNEAGSDMDGAGLWAGGGGRSALYSKPVWQSAPGVPADGARDLPDVSFAAAGGHDGYLVVQGAYRAPAGNLPVMVAGGTSAATPAMAAIMALVVQKYGRQGNAAPTLYRLANSKYSTVFHDVVKGNTSVPGVPGFSAGVGYDLATGLGSLDATALVDAWGGTAAGPIVVQLLNQPVTALSNQAVTLVAEAYGGVSPLYAYSWDFGDGSKGTGATSSHTYANANSVITYQASVTATDGTSTSQPQYVGVTIIPVGVPLATLATPSLDVDALPGTAIAFQGGTLGQWPGGTSGLTYSWNFGDGSTASGQAVSHSFLLNNNSAYTVTLTVTDASRHSATATRKVYSTYDALFLAGHQGPLDVRDLLALAAYWGTPGTVSGAARAASVYGDLNRDGKVDDADINLWIQIFSSSVSQ